MQIKTNDGNYDVASKSLGNTALGLGIAGLATSLLSGGASLMGFGGGSGQNKYVTKEELEMAMTIANKDSRIALLESEKTTDAKLVDVYKASAAQDKEIRALISQSREEQAAVNAAQMAHNAANDATISVLKSQTEALLGVTKMYIPSSNVCQSQCGCGCMANQ